MAADAKELQYDSDLQSLGLCIESFRSTLALATTSATRMENVAIMGQLGRIDSDIATLNRMVQQHRIDRAHPRA